MGDWLAVVGTLAGALVAGGISFVLLWSSNKHAPQIVKINLAEERARWAAERQLERIQIFYETIEKLIASVEQFRIQQAWASTIAGSESEKAPSWVSHTTSPEKASKMHSISRIPRFHCWMRIFSQSIIRLSRTIIMVGIFRKIKKTVYSTLSN